MKALDIVITRKDRVYRKLVRLSVEDRFNPKKIFRKKALANLDKVDSTKIYTQRISTSDERIIYVGSF